MFFAGPMAIAMMLASVNIAEPAEPAAAKTAAPAKLRPLSEVISSVSERTGYSFIVDARLLDGRVMPPITRRRPSERLLRQRFAQLDLDLHRVGATTYAVTQAPKPVVLAAAAASAPSMGPETIIVTGAAAAGLASRSLYDVDEDLLAALATGSTADAVYDIPVSLASVTAANTALYGTTAGLNLIDLRGFGPERSLVLMDGRRRTVFSGGNGTIAGVDLNSIAAPFLERIEVGPSAGGAWIGAEAVAGAVNFVTRDDVDGVEIGARYGLSELGDAQEIEAYVLAGGGFSNGAGAITAGLAYAREDGLLGRDRPLTEEAYGFALDGRTSTDPNAEFLPGFGGSSLTPNGQIAGLVVAGEVYPTFGALVLDGAGGAEPNEGRLDQLYNWAGVSSLILPNERVTGLFKVAREFADGFEASLSVHAGWSRTDVTLAPTPTSIFRGGDPVVADAIILPIDHPSVTSAVRDAVTTHYGPGVEGLAITRRFLELGARRRQTDRYYGDLYAGLERVGETSRFALGYRYGRNEAVSNQFNRIDRTRLLTAADPVACAADAACTPVDLITLGGVTPAAADYIRAESLGRRILLQEHEGTIDGERETGLFTFRAGAVGRWTQIDDDGADFTASDVIGAFDSPEQTADLATGELHGAVELSPTSLGAVGSISGVVGARLVATDATAAAPIVAGSLEWRPVEAFALFAEAERGARPPNLWELYAVGVVEQQFVRDPCGAPDKQVVIDNCASAGPLGVSTGFAQSDFLAAGGFLGNPDLKSEETRFWSAGFEATLREDLWIAPGRLHVRAAWLDHRIDNFVSGVDDTLDKCFQSVGLSDPACGANALSGEPLIQRDPLTEQISFVGTTLRNNSVFEWRGVDAEVSLELEPAGLPIVDRLWLSARHAYLEEARLDMADSAEELTGDPNFPRHRTLIAAGAESGDVALSALVTRRGAVRSADYEGPIADIPAFTRVDLSARYNGLERTALIVTVENLLDVDPPIAATSEAGNVLAQHYDVVGRRFSIALTTSF